MKPDRKILPTTESVQNFVNKKRFYEDEIIIKKLKLIFFRLFL